MDDAMAIGAEWNQIGNGIDGPRTTRLRNLLSVVNFDKSLGEPSVKPAKIKAANKTD